MRLAIQSRVVSQSSGTRNNLTEDCARLNVIHTIVISSQRRIYDSEAEDLGRHTVNAPFCGSLAYTSQEFSIGGERGEDPGFVPRVAYTEGDGVISGD